MMLIFCLISAKIIAKALKMDLLVKYLTRYSPPVIIALVCLFIGGYFVKYGIERTLEAEFQKRDRQLELAMKRQSNFQEKVMWEKYLVLTSQNREMHELRAEINGSYITNSDSKTFKNGPDVPRLTAVYEQLNINRFLIGEEMYQLMRKQARILLQFANLDIKNKNDMEKYRNILKQFEALDKMYRVSMQRMFNINSSTSSTHAASSKQEKT